MSDAKTILGWLKETSRDYELSGDINEKYIKASEVAIEIARDICNNDRIVNVEKKQTTRKEAEKALDDAWERAEP